MSYWKNVNPVGAIADFRSVFREAGPNRWRLAVLSAVTTIGVFSVMTGESWKKPRPLPEITYITAWPAHRTDAESKAFVAENQRRKDEREALLKAQDKIGQDLYMALGRATGVDVDRIKADADAERAAADAAAKAKADALIDRSGKAPVGR